MVNVEVRQNKRRARPKHEVRGVGQKEILPAVPEKMEWLCKEEQKYEDAVIKRKDAKDAAGIEGFEEVGDVERVDQNAGDKKSGEREEEIDANIGRAADHIDEIEKSAAGL